MDQPATDRPGTPANGEIPGAIRLRACPRCGYSLEGLPARHRCPECGFEYDEYTFILAGISRGTAGMQPARKWLWALVGLMAWVLPQAAFRSVGSTLGTLSALMLVAFWSGLILFLLLTSRRERKGIDTFLFTAGGFGYVANMPGQTTADARLFTWREADTVLVDRKGSQWYRLRIGQGSTHLRDLHHTLLDVGIRCNDETAAWIEHTLTQRIAAARGTML